MSKKKIRTGNYLSRTLRSFAKKPFGDSSIKLVFSNKQILAHLIRDITPELRDVPYDKIANEFIEQTEVVHRGLRVQKDYIDGMNTESIELDEAKLRFDVRFNVALPNATPERYEIHFDLEGQGSLHPGYSLPKRMILYICRLLSSQIKSLNKAKKYDLLQPACSIWVCCDKKQKNPNGSIAVWELKENTEFRYGEPVFYDKDFDYMRIAVITVPASNATSENRTLELLRHLFSEDYDKKLENLEKMGIQVDSKFKEEVEDMTGLMVALAERHYDEGYDKGRAEGLAEGARKTVCAMRAAGFTDESIKNYVDLTLEEIRKIPRE